jgi:cyclophilin family peptidyl-prolyl cis-trans isomerase
MNANPAQKWTVLILLGAAAVSAWGQTAVGQPPKNGPRKVPPAAPPNVIQATPAGPQQGAPAVTNPPPMPPVSVPARAPTPPKPHSNGRAVPRVALDIACGTESWGQIIIELDEERAPDTVRNFLTYVDQGFYNGTIFHRVIRDYVAQAGGYTAPDQLKKLGQRPAIHNEGDNRLNNLRYTVAMARGREPDSATSQFFINLADNPKLDYFGPDGWGYCVFGLVVSGQNVLDRIANTDVQPNPQAPGENSRPVTPPLIRRAYRAPAENLPATAGGAQPMPARPNPTPAPPPKPPAPSPAPPAEPKPAPDSPEPTPAEPE